MGQASLADDDPIASRLDEAKATYQRELEVAKQIVVKAFNDADEKARDAADVDLVKTIKAERADFESTGKLPSRFPTTEYVQRRRKLRGDLNNAYTQAIRDYLKARKDDLATKIKNERDAFQKAEPTGLTSKVDQDSKDEFGPTRFDSGPERVRGVDVKVGNPQFTLVWDSKADLDLHVIEPGGKEIFWNDPKGRRGGELDVDNVEGFGPENIYWIKQNDDGSKSLGSGPPGEYKWFVSYYGGNMGVPVQTHWKVRVKHDGKVEVFSGTLNVPAAKSKTFTLPMGQ
jgi:hypothetical protein